MSTGTFLVTKALQRVGAHSLIRQANANALEDGFMTLNSMLQLWLSKDIDLGIAPIEAIGSEVGEPADTTQAIIDNLAIMLAPDFDNSSNSNVSQTLIRNAAFGFSNVQAIYRKITIPDKVISSTTARGQGNRSRLFERPIYVGRGATIKN